MISIRKAQIKDSELIFEFIKKLAKYEKLEHEVKTTIELLKENLFSNNKKAYCLIADYDSKPVGFALYFYNYSTFLGKPGIYLEDLFVDTDYRGKGIGKALLLELIKIAKNENLGRVEWSVLDWNKPSIDFYKSLGAKAMDEWTVFRITEDKFEGLIQG